MVDLLNILQRSPIVRLAGPRIYIRPPRRRDQEPWVEIRRISRDFLVPWEPTWPEDATTGAAFRRRLDRQLAEWRDGTGYAFFIFGRGTDELLGGITLANLRRGVAQSGSLGYWMGKPYAGQGYMSEAVQLVLQFAFDSLGLNRVEAACLPHNTASRTLLVRGGFTEEGLARQYLCINGRWQDHVTYAILRGDPRPKLQKIGKS